jgi:hypothetical protein
MQRIFKHPFHPVATGFLYLFMVGVLLYVIDYFPRPEIEEMLKVWVPWSLRINFFLLICAVLFCYRDIAGAVRNLFVSPSPQPPSVPPHADLSVSSSSSSKGGRAKGFLLFGLVLIAFVLVSFTVPRVHRIYYDEDIYANTGQVIALTGKAAFSNYGTFEYGQYDVPWSSYNKEPGGWPFLLSLVFQLFGVNELYGFFLNNLLFIAGVLAACFIAWRLTESFFAAFTAALAYVLIPDNLIWSNTVAVEPSAAFFAGITVLAAIVYLKTKQDRHLFLLAVLFPFATQMRPESLMIGFWVAAAILVFSPGLFLEKKFWGMGLLTAVFLLPQALHLYAMSGQSWGAEGPKFALSFFPENFRINGWYYLNNEKFPVLVSALAAIGLFSRFQSRPQASLQKKWRLLVAIWFLLFWGIFLFFYAGSYQYGADVRFAVVSFMPLAVLAGIGGERIRAAIRHISKAPGPVAGVFVILFLLLSWLPFLPHIRTVGQEAWGARFDHHYARKFAGIIPERSIVLTHNPTMFNLWGKNAIQMYAGINNPDVIQHLTAKYRGELYYHHNYWCNAKSDTNRRICQGIAERYDLEEVAREREQDFEYGLYRMSPNKQEVRREGNKEGAEKK